MNDNRYTEREIAQTAERMLTAALRAKIGTLGFKHHLSKDSKKSISYAFGSANYKLGKSKDENLRYYMNKLSIIMEKHGYIQHYGDNGVREGSERKRSTPKNTTYSFKTHVWKLPPKDFIEDAIRKSGVIEYVLDSITQARGEAIVFDMLNFFNGKKF